MTIQEAIDTLKYVESNDEGIKSTLNGVIDRLTRYLGVYGDVKISKRLARHIRDVDRKSSHYKITSAWSDTLTDYVSKWVGKLKKGQGAEDTEEQAEGHDEEHGGILKWFCRKDVWIPLLVSVVFLALGLVLGYTVFTEEQDRLYFIMESIKDIIGGIVPGLLAKEIVDRTIQKNSQMKVGESRRDVIVGVLMVFEIAALLFSGFLLLGTKLAIIERFLHWSKLAYFWMSISVALISVICTVTLAMRLFKSRKVDDGRDSV